MRRWRVERVRGDCPSRRESRDPDLSLAGRATAPPANAFVSVVLANADGSRPALRCGRRASRACPGSPFGRTFTSSNRVIRIPANRPDWRHCGGKRRPLRVAQARGLLRSQRARRAARRCPATLRSARCPAPRASARRSGNAERMISLRWPRIQISYRRDCRALRAPGTSSLVTRPARCRRLSREHGFHDKNPRDASSAGYRRCLDGRRGPRTSGDPRRTCGLPGWELGVGYGVGQVGGWRLGGVADDRAVDVDAD